MAAQKKRQASGSELYARSDQEFKQRTPEEISDLDHFSDNDPVNLIHNLNKDQPFVYEEEPLPEMDNDIERIKIIVLHFNYSQADAQADWPRGVFPPL